MAAKTGFEEEYKKLNSAQKDAVDSTEGPVMVVAGPGTGKTQILALRIGNILKKTDVKADGILCLTFTNAAVKAMRERLRKYIGSEAGKVRISTFHGFGMEMIETYYGILGFQTKPELLDEKSSVVLLDEILHEKDWQYLRPRNDASRHFRDLKSLMSFLKRERINPEQFTDEIATEIKKIAEDPESISSRGESKGQLKKDIQRKIEGLERTLEAAKFFALYEGAKKEKNFLDYDDILEGLVALVEESDEARNFIRENFLYILIDEHQDSSGIQNEFLKKVWGEEEKPNIFVVGDDRQLIYGFGGASLEYFQNFQNAFGQAKLITLTENYRSTQKILDSAHELLQSSITKEKLNSNHKENHAIRLIEAYYPRDEIIFAALEIKDKIAKGEDPNDMAILVPKNKQVESAMSILRGMGIPVSGGESMNFFDLPEALAFLRVLKIASDPGNGPALAASFFDKLSGIPPLKAHEFLRGADMKNFSVLSVSQEKNSLFSGASEINTWLEKLRGWVADSGEQLYPFIQKVGAEFLLKGATGHEDLVRRIEALRTVLHLALQSIEKEPKITLSGFLTFMERIEEYGEKIPLAIFSPDDGVKILTLHGSKGLEFDYVWIAHMDERSFSGGRKDGFTLPEKLKARADQKDELTLRRQLYVAITRAKRFCAISYPLRSYTGGDLAIAEVLAGLAEGFEKQDAAVTEKIILTKNPEAYVVGTDSESTAASLTLEGLKHLVAKEYADSKVSVSLLNNFFECPWKWYFRNLLQLPEPKSESLEFGNVVHGSIDQILKLGKTPTVADIQRIVAVEVGKTAFGNERKQKEMLGLAQKIAELWSKERLPEISSSRENELSVSLSDERFPHLSIYGKIDLLEKLDKENVRVTDFKTGAPRKKNDIEKLDEEERLSGYLRQLAMYSYLINNSTKWRASVRESRLEFLEAKNAAERFYETVVGHKEIEHLIQDIQDYDRLVKSGEWASRACNYNSYGKNTECEYCQLAQIYKS